MAALRYDIAVLGGGPAGVAAAIALRQARPELRIVLVEASSYSRWRVGESLAPGGEQLLRGLGCWEPFCAENFLQSYGATAAWGDDRPHDNEFVFSAGGSGWHLDRARFDALLATCAEAAGTEVRRETRFVNGARIPDGDWRLTLRSGGANHEINAGFVIDATGRSSAFASRLGARQVPHDSLFGIYVMYRFPVDFAPEDANTLVEAQEEGWWYSALLPKARMAVAWMSDADLLRPHHLHEESNWLEKLETSRLTKSRLVYGRAEFPARIWAARSQRLEPVCGTGWIAAGDAASTFDPLSSMGMIKALRGGKLAAFAVLDHLRGLVAGFERYQDILAREYLEYQTTHAWFYGKEQRWPLSSFWRRRHALEGAAHSA